MKKYLIPFLLSLLLPLGVWGASIKPQTINQKLDKIISLLEPKLGSVVTPNNVAAESEIKQNFTVNVSSTILGSLLPQTDNTASVGTSTSGYLRRFAFGNFVTLNASTTNFTSSTISGLATFSNGFISQASSSVGGGLLTTSNGLLSVGNLNASSSIFLNGVATSTGGTPFYLNGFVSNNSSSTISDGLFLNKGAQTNALTMQGGENIQLNQASNRGFLRHNTATLYTELYNLTSVGNGGLQIGDASVVINFNSGAQAVEFVSTHFAPTGSGTVDDLGTATQRWQNLYLGGGLMSASSSVGGTLSVTGNLTVSSSISVVGNILSATNNSSNLGGFSNAFKNIYVSTTLFDSAPPVLQFTSSTAAAGVTSLTANTLAGLSCFTTAAAPTEANFTVINNLMPTNPLVDITEYQSSDATQAFTYNASSTGFMITVPSAISFPGQICWSWHIYGGN